MIQKFIATAIIILSSVINSAANIAQPNPISNAAEYTAEYGTISPITPPFLDNAVITSWMDNWFVNINGGMSSFIGSPIGCEDLFGRIKPTLQISIGKWHTPIVGNRITVQGFQWTSGEIKVQNYTHWHADILWNLLPTFNTCLDSKRWNIVPFIGIGLINNYTAKRHSFALNYGIQGRFNIANNLHILAELGNTTTFKDADGFGSPCQFGDNLLSLSAGISWTFGRRTGWKKILDPAPYIRHNQYLSEHVLTLEDKTHKLLCDYHNKNHVISELRKILEIEGLFNKYRHCFNNKSDYTCKSYIPLNNYSGLNSLRKRLKNRRLPVIESNKTTNDIENLDNAITTKQDYTDKLISNNTKDIINPDENPEQQVIAFKNTPDEYLRGHNESGDCIGAPIFFFFKLGTSSLIDESQTANLNEIARIAIRYGLKIEVVGAADRNTGSSEINNNLGEARAQYILNRLIEYGVDETIINIVSAGGIDSYIPNEANRNAIVRLYLP